MDIDFIMEIEARAAALDGMDYFEVLRIPQDAGACASAVSPSATAAAIPPSSAMVFIRILLFRRQSTLDAGEIGWQGLRLGYARKGAGGRQEECVLECQAAIHGR